MDSLLRVLDRTIGEREVYMLQKQRRIDSLELLFVGVDMTDRERYNLNNALISEYDSFRYDSTLQFVRRNMEIAARLGDRELQNDALLRLTFVLTSGGMYLEALENLSAIDGCGLSPRMQMLYYKSMERVYFHLARYAGESSYASRYETLSCLYLDSMERIVQVGSDDYRSIMSRKMVSEGNFATAKEMLRDYLATLSFGSHDYAIVSSTLSYVYQDEPEGDMREYYLILSAISDLRSVVKENESLQNLAVVFLEKGDVDRAYRYCTIAMEDANFYNSRLRRIEIARMQPIIEKAYRMKLDQQHRHLQAFTLTLAVTIAVLLVTLVFLFLQMKALVRARRDIEESNAELKRLNTALVESTHIKEEYIGHFMCLCSAYIDKLERYRSSVLTRIVSGKLDELRGMVHSSALVDHEIKTFYQNFDKIFLRIFPNFIVEFNKLLREEEQIVVPRGKLLTNELRIFALIRLGIDDSSRIARFLRYSANTVYTYRTKVRNKALDRKNFEALIMEINLF